MDLVLWPKLVRSKLSLPFNKKKLNYGGRPRQTRRLKDNPKTVEPPARLLSGIKKVNKKGIKKNNNNKDSHLNIRFYRNSSSYRCSTVPAGSSPWGTAHVEEGSHHDKGHSQLNEALDMSGRSCGKADSATHWSH